MKRHSVSDIRSLNQQLPLGLTAPQTFTCVVICFISSLRFYTVLIIQLYTLNRRCNWILCKCNSEDYADLLWVSIPPLSSGASKWINPCSVFPCSPVPALLEITKLWSWFSPDLQCRNKIMANCEEWSMMCCIIWIVDLIIALVVSTQGQQKKPSPPLEYDPFFFYFKCFSRESELIHVKLLCFKGPLQIKRQGFEIWIFSFLRHFLSYTWNNLWYTKCFVSSPLFAYQVLVPSPGKS